MPETLPGPLFLAGQAWLDFVNTTMADRGRELDLLPDIDHLFGWLVAAGLMDAPAAAAARTRWGTGRSAHALLAEALALRRALRELGERLAAGHRTVPPRFRAAINRVLAARSSFPQLVEDHGLKQAMTTTIREPLGILAGVAQSAADLLTNGDYDLVKHCAGPRCVLLFYDTTKNHARRFCTAAVCGNRFKAAAHYRRMKATRG
jgi:predicted RNA-binding Zn ribbon-like protein